MKEQQKPGPNPLFDYRIKLSEIATCLVMFLIVAILNIATNSMLIYLMRRIRRLSHATYIFIFCICISDICIGCNQILCVILRVIMEGMDRVTTQRLALMSAFFSYLLEPLSATLLITIAMDRYMHLRYLTTYRIIMTRRRAVVTITACLVANLCFTFAVMLSIIHGIHDIFSLILAGTYITMLSAVTVFYIRAYRSVQTRVKDSSVHLKRQTRRGPSKPNDAIFRGIAYILISLLICYTPYVLLRMAACILHIAGRPDKDAIYPLALAYVLKSLSASMNAIMLIILNKEYKRFVRKFVFRRSSVKRIRVSPLETRMSKIDRRVMDGIASQIEDRQGQASKGCINRTGIATIGQVEVNRI